MRILLDENFPLALLWKLQEEGHQVDHIILLGLRGAPDRVIIDRLNSEDLLLLTHDQEFLDRVLTRSRVIVSRVSQSQPIAARVEIWLEAIREYFSRDWSETQFEVFDDGKLRLWQKPGCEQPDRATAARIAWCRIISSGRRRRAARAGDPPSPRRRA